MPKKKAEQAKPVESPLFRAVAIPYQKNFKKFAQQVEETLNKFNEAGYQGEINTHPQGLLYIGRLMERRENPLRQILQQMFTHAPPEEGGVNGLSQPTRVLMNAVCEGIDMNKPETFVPTIEKRANVFRQYHTNTLKQSVKELEADIATHSERCNDPTCNTPKLASAVAEQLKKHLALQVS
jgi:hypothetical protein